MLEEAEAIRLGMLMARDASWSKVEFQSDCKKVIDMINAKEKHEASVAVILEDILVLRDGFDHCTFSYASRLSNSVAHNLAKFAVNIVSVVRWERLFPVWLQESAKRDVEVFTSFVSNLVVSS